MTRPRTAFPRAVVVNVLALTCVVATANAQDDEQSRWVQHATAAAVNTALGGLTAGTWQALSGKSFWRGFKRGAGGGLAVFAGKRLIAERSPAAWWAGRQLAAIGSSEVANASLGRPAFKIITVPVGPIRIHFHPRSMRATTASVDFVSSVAAIVVGTRRGNRLAIDESLAAGAIVFLAPETSNAIGGNQAGIITISELVPDGSFPPLESKRSVISHELIHSAQYDFVLTAWGDAVQDAVMRKLHWSGRITRYVDFNFVLPLQIAANGLIRYESRPWEKEAQALVPDDR